MGFTWKKAILGVVLFLVCFGTLTASLHTVTRNDVLGIDLYIFWEAGRAIFINHESPYNDSVAILSQLAVYKRVATPDEDQLAFVYPPYSLLVLLPLYWMPFDWAQAAWMSFNLLTFITASTILLKSPNKWAPLSMVFLYPFTFGLLTGNFAILITTVLIILFYALCRWKNLGFAWQILMGAAVGWLTFKPQFVWLYLIVFGLAALKKKYIVFLWSAVFTFVALLIASFIVVPNWPSEWLGRLTNYTGYNQTWPILTMFLNQMVNVKVSIPLTISAFLLCIGITVWLLWMWWRDRLHEILLLSWTGFIIYLFHPHGASYEQLAFLLPLFVWVMVNEIRPLPIIFFWGGSILLSWTAFILSRQINPIPTVIEWPFIFHFAWLGWLFIFSPLHPFQKSRHNSLGSL